MVLVVPDSIEKDSTLHIMLLITILAGIMESNAIVQAILKALKVENFAAATCQTSLDVLRAGVKFERIMAQFNNWPIALKLEYWEYDLLPNKLLASELEHLGLDLQRVAGVLVYVDGALDLG